jgi:hypothetical protein
MERKPFNENIFEKDAPSARKLTDEEVMEQRKRLAAERAALEQSVARRAA